MLPGTFSTSQLQSASENGPPTMALSNYVAQALRKSAQEERFLEEKRLGKRARRAAEATTAGDIGRTPSVSTPGGPGTPGLIAPDSDKKTSKKELKKAAEAKATEAQQHAHANETARLAMGVGGGFMFGGKKKTYSWMTAASGSSTPKGFGSRINTAVNNSSPGTPSGAASGNTSGGGAISVGKRFGEWREDKEKGEGVQVRDVVHVLEEDRKEDKVLQRAYMKMGSRPGGTEG
jgi:hypothetical protein